MADLSAKMPVRSESAEAVMEMAIAVAAELRVITVTDARWRNEGANVEVASEESQRHSMLSVLSGIKGISMASLSGPAKPILQNDREMWTAQGERTLALKKGICTDCAAAAAVRLLQYVDLSDQEAKVEIVSTGTHGFVVVNRAGDIDDPLHWGDDAIVIDVWMQNQFAEGDVPGALWANQWDHTVATFILDNAGRLRVDVCLRERKA